MIRRRPSRALRSTLFLALLTVAAQSCGALRPGARIGALVERDFAVAAGDATEADVHVAFYGGKADVACGSDDRVVALATRDNLDEVDPRCEESRDDRHVTARLWLDTEKNLSVDDDDDPVNEWKLALGRRVPIDLDLGLAVCKAEVDLGGVPLRRARVSMVAGESTLRFSRPLPRDVDELKIELAAGEFTVTGLGNARCRSIAVKARAGSFKIDCSGAWSGSSFLRIDAEMGGVDVVVPRDLAVSVDATATTFGNLSMPDFRSDRTKRFTSPNWDSGDPRLTIEIDASFGSVNVIRD